MIKSALMIVIYDIMMVNIFLLYEIPFFFIGSACWLGVLARRAGMGAGM